jgi:hypothetical protein
MKQVQTKNIPVQDKIERAKHNLRNQMEQLGLLADRLGVTTGEPLTPADRETIRFTYLRELRDLNNQACVLFALGDEGAYGAIQQAIEELIEFANL